MSLGGFQVIEDEYSVIIWERLFEFNYAEIKTLLQKCKNGQKKNNFLLPAPAKETQPVQPHTSVREGFLWHRRLSPWHISLRLWHDVYRLGLSCYVFGTAFTTNVYPCGSNLLLRGHSEYPCNEGFLWQGYYYPKNRLFPATESRSFTTSARLFSVAV